ncbi:hypothetical protein NEOKW01_0946 [Nematocida sp. AWRm80]|nr:hypothetical protein NEOKW01_0946 [Nematocida sp. AWRm80]
MGWNKVEQKIGRGVRMVYFLFIFVFYIFFCLTLIPVAYYTGRILRGLGKREDRYKRVVGSIWLNFTHSLICILVGENTYVIYNKDIVNRKGNCMILSNHSTYMDWIYLWSMLLAMKKENIMFIVKKGVGSVYFLKMGMEMLDFVTLDRNMEKDKQKLVNACDYLRRKDSFSLILFPEGTFIDKYTKQKDIEYLSINKHLREGTLPTTPKLGTPETRPKAKPSKREAKERKTKLPTRTIDSLDTTAPGTPLTEQSTLTTPNYNYDPTTGNHQTKIPPHIKKVFQNVIFPRVKGFSLLVDELNTSIDYIINCTIFIRRPDSIHSSPLNSPSINTTRTDVLDTSVNPLVSSPTTLRNIQKISSNIYPSEYYTAKRMISGQCSKMNTFIFCEYIPTIKEVSKDKQEWLYNVFMEKDALLTELNNQSNEQIKEYIHQKTLKHHQILQLKPTLRYTLLLLAGSLFTFLPTIYLFYRLISSTVSYIINLLQ